jgi:MFS family permease
MAYLRNSAVNLLNLHYGLHALVLNGAGVFFVVFLLKAGVSTPLVFAAIGLLLLGRFTIRPLVLVFAPRLGLRALVVIGTILTAVQYPLLAEVHGADLALLAFCFAGAVGDAFYWTSYHAYFASLGDLTHRGHQVSAREAMSSLAAIVGPVIGGWALVAAGPRIAFGAAAILQLLAALPLLRTPDVPVAGKATGVFAAAIPSMMLFACDSWMCMSYIFAWQIALFLSLGESFTAFGGVLAFAAIVGGLGGLLLGKYIDAGHGRRAVWLTFAGTVAITVVRALSTGNPAAAVIANALGALVGCIYIPTLMTNIYNEAKRSPCPLRFHLMLEGGWDFGGICGCVVVALLSATGTPLPWLILLTLPGILVWALLLRRGYAAPQEVEPSLINAVESLR